MGWMNRRPKRGSDQPKQLLYFAEQQLENEFYAVIRVTWFEGSRVRLVEESAYSFYDGMTPHDLRLLLKDLLTRGADVSVCCIDGADELGLKS